MDSGSLKRPCARALTIEVLCTTSVMPSKVSELVRNLVDDIDILGKYPEDSDYIIGKDLSNKNRFKEDILR